MAKATSTDLPFRFMMNGVSAISQGDHLVPFLTIEALVLDMKTRILSTLPTCKGKGHIYANMDKWIKTLAVNCTRTWNSLWDWLVYFEQFLLTPMFASSIISNSNHHHRQSLDFTAKRLLVSCLRDDICQYCESTKFGTRGISATGLMLLCDWCDSGCHTRCANIRHIPEDNFYCNFCQVYKVS